MQRFRPCAVHLAVHSLSDDDLDDMFAESDEEGARPAVAAPPADVPSHAEEVDKEEEKAGSAPPAGEAAPAPAAAPSGAAEPSGSSAAAAAATAEPEVDYGSWPIKELRRFLEERGQVGTN